MKQMLSATFYTDNGLKKSHVALFALFLFAICLLTVFQDFLQSNYNSSAFYFSESILFRSFWILALPLAWAQIVLLQYLSKPKFIAKLIGGIFLASLVHLLAFALVVNSLSALFFDHTYAFSEVFYYSITEDLYKALLIYTFIAGIYSIRTSKSTDKIKSTPSTITIQDGRKHVLVQVQDIMYIEASSPYIAIHTSDKLYLHNASLKSISEQFDGNQFVRIHKSTIVNLNEVLSYQSRLNGDYDLELKNGSQLRLSRNYASNFKQHFERSSS